MLPRRASGAALVGLGALERRNGSEHQSFRATAVHVSLCIGKHLSLAAWAPASHSPSAGPPCPTPFQTKSAEHPNILLEVWRAAPASTSGSPKPRMAPSATARRGIMCPVRTAYPVYMFQRVESQGGETWGSETGGLCNVHSHQDGHLGHSASAAHCTQARHGTSLLLDVYRKALRA